MVIRRIREHAAHHNWFAVAIDITIVVVGVFLGMQATNWNQNRTDGDEARTFRDAIIANLRANEVDLATRTSYYEQVRLHALAALDIFDGRSSQAGEKFLADAYLAASHNRRPLVRAAYDEMIESSLGQNRMGQKTRAKMSTFYAQIPQFNENMATITSYKEQLRRAMPYAIQRRISDQCGDRIHTLPNGMQIVAPPEHCRPGLDSRAVSWAVDRLRSTPGLDRELTWQAADLDTKLSLMRRYAALAHRLRVDLEADAS